MRPEQQRIISALNVAAFIDAEAEIDARVQFLREYLQVTGATGFVLGISGGQDSSLAGRLCQLAVERVRADGSCARGGAGTGTGTAALDILRTLTGGGEDTDFHDGQFEAIETLVDGRRRALVVQRTGWGKSAVYFVATLLLRRQGAGPTILVSPLLALMRDQIAAASRAGVRAVAINSTNAH
eukprot:gene46342-56746_t